jgi:hypothetical protein
MQQQQATSAGGNCWQQQQQQQQQQRCLQPHHCQQLQMTSPEQIQASCTST